MFFFNEDIFEFLLVFIPHKYLFIKTPRLQKTRSIGYKISLYSFSLFFAIHYSIKWN